ncbi:type I restriction-modification system subunit M [Wohlfahrtiimonas chitiniclastica]|uniref:type I restriction-modification system subunit M n=1 Tax=Wohlfahrtiimonas chitiniclastica TaxID=400946 RepID=UPI000B992C62|nr:type I restriction-modification system subunit M [Wohlfahrtiimonas chitiniclastica]MBS7836296.1 type I restriction-modification system subunit M [Wohlfahrtiimonas chitiniclastica]OYQ89693.1 type I restriction-modification system subunit M [Wohlfahrtiimonas chitiniclastica]
MAIKKTELYSSLWASCDELRGGMDASQYKDYVLTMLFLKYVSDRYKGDAYGMILVPEGASFDDIALLKGDKEIGDKLNKIIGKIAEENDLKRVIDVADFNDEDKLGKGKEMIDRLSKLVGIFESLDLSSNRAEGDDLLGDAYEYLMRHFATESGKSKGQFYTPAEVSRILAKVIGIDGNTTQDMTVYDPACGSGSLLLKASDEAPRGLTIYGQEMDNATSALAKMNMILHDNATAKIWNDNTLSMPRWKEENGDLKMFDFAVANPPFSSKNWTSGLNAEEDEYQRFSLGIPPEKNGDYAFLLHIIKSLKSTGKGAVILPHGVLFRGNAEARIRENLVKQGYIKGIIGLPANLFYGTGIPACVIVIDKEGASSRDQIFMIDASKGFIKDGNKNRLRSQDVHKIVDVFTDRLEVPKYSRMVPLAEIVENEFNLNIPRYIDSSDSEDLHDLTAHLNGGIPNHDIENLNAYWEVFPTLQKTLFKPLREGYSEGVFESSEVKNAILNHEEFKNFATESLKPFTAWAKDSNLKSIALGDLPKAWINKISHSLLASYAEMPLLDKYDIYQILMSYWAETMQDDVYLITQNGWLAGQLIREIIPKKDKNNKNIWLEQHDFEFKKRRYVAELIPPSLIISRWFAEDQKKVDELQSKIDEASSSLELYIEENSGDQGLLIDAMNDKDKFTKKSINDYLKKTLDKDEIVALKYLLKLINAESNAKSVHKKAQGELDLSVFKKYFELSVEDCQSLIVDDKWLATLEANIIAEIERVTQQLANRVKELEERYENALPVISQSVDELSKKVAEHLKAMGLEWSL